METLETFAVITPISVLMAYSFLVLWRHFRMWRRYRWAKLPLHVWLIALSYYLLLLSLVTRSLDWRALLWMPGVITGIFAMRAIWHAQDQREQIMDVRPKEKDLDYDVW